MSRPGEVAVAATLDAAQVPRFHDPVTDGYEANEQRMRQPREHGIRAFDEDAPVTGRWLAPGEIEPAR